MQPFVHPSRALQIGVLCGATLAFLFSPTHAAGPVHPIWKRISQPLYPPDAVARGIEGELLVEFNLDAKGKVVTPRVVRANPAGIFDQSVLSEMTRWRYSVGSGDAGEAAKDPRLIRFQFQLAPCAGPWTPVITGQSSELESMYLCVGGGPRKIKSSVEADELLFEGQLREQISRPEYIEALRRLEADKELVLSQRMVPNDASQGVARRTPLPVPAVNPQFRRALTPGVAVVMFDVNGSGRVENVTWPAPSAGYDLARDFAQTVALWLFESKIEDTVGIKRVGLTAGLIVEFENKGKSSCGQLKTAIPVDIEERICLRVL